MRVKIVKIRERAEISRYQTQGAAGFDLHAAIDEEVVLKSGEFRAIGTGIGVEIPEGYELQIRARSGLAYKYGVTLANGVGTIDADFRDEIQILLINHGAEDFMITPGMRIAQGVVARYETVEWEEVEELGETERSGGLGSTGLK